MLWAVAAGALHQTASDGTKGMMGNTHNSVLGSHATTGGVSGIVGKLLIIDSRNGD